MINIDSKIKISELDFTDSYIKRDDLMASTVFFGSQAPKKPSKNQAKLLSSVMVKFDEIKSLDPKEKDFMVSIEGRNFRCCEVVSVDNRLLFARQMPYKFVDIKNSGLGTDKIDVLLSPSLNRGGLILVCGAPGNGKTTTAAAIVKARLEKFGGVCLTAEDPNEIPLEGIHGTGICLQGKINRKDGFAGKIKELLRSYPAGQNSMMLIGEIRDGETAVQAIRASIDGRLIVATLHADSVENALKRIGSMATKEMSLEESSSLLAESFRICVHQKISENGLSAKMLQTSTQVSNMIYKQKYHMLKANISSQEIKRKQGHREFD
jgi:type II secretory ATPase GspE/PulE/Tfp pilus assembly ATPase PilB-like protein